MMHDMGLIKEKNKNAQNHKKSYVYERKQDLEFELSDIVFV